MNGPAPLQVADCRVTVATFGDLLVVVAIRAVVRTRRRVVIVIVTVRVAPFPETTATAVRLAGPELRTRCCCHGLDERH
jgi:hypothetical protein